MWEFIAKPFGIIMEFIYKTLAFENYGLAIIFFTIFVRILILPLTIKQQKSTIKMQAIQPELNALKERYGDDKQKLYEEQNKIYQKYGVNSMAGCLPTLIQFPMILILYRIIRMPLTYISQFSSDFIASLAKISGEQAVNEIKIISFFQKSADKIAEAIEGTSMTASEFSEKLVNMKFLKIFDLGETPSIFFWKWSGDDWKVYLPLLIIPIVAFATAWLQQKLLTPKQDKSKKEDAAGALGMMTKFMPFMSLFFCFILPAGLGLYFTVGNILSIGQTTLINKLYKKKKEGS